MVADFNSSLPSTYLPSGVDYKESPNPVETATYDNDIDLQQRRRSHVNEAGQWGSDHEEEDQTVDNGPEYPLEYNVNNSVHCCPFGPCNKANDQIYQTIMNEGTKTR